MKKKNTSMAFKNIIYKVVIENYFGRKNDCYMSNIRVI